MLCANILTMQLERLNYYQILDVAPNATQESIFHAYRHARSTYSLKNPDLYKVFSPAEAKAWASLIEEAYSVLGFPNNRRAYDQDLHRAIMDHQVPEATEQKAPLEPETLPEGHAQTKISQYKVDKNFEEQIAREIHYDGTLLKKIREYKNIELSDFSAHTCIAIRHLYAIENNTFQALPAAVFVRGYITQYCKTLGLDSDVVIPSFMALMKNG